MPKFMKILNNISRSQAIYRSENLKADGICAHHHAFIFGICCRPGRTQEELAREFCLNKSTVARTLTHLEETGYIRRETDHEDKRNIRVFPTDKMSELLPRVREISNEWNSFISKDISGDELDIFYSVLSRMENRAKELITKEAE